MSDFTIGSTIYTKLGDDASITGYVGTTPKRIYPDIAPLSMAQSFPYITYSIISVTPTNTKGPVDAGNAVLTGPILQKSPLDIVRVQINTFSTEYTTGVNLSSKVRNVLDRGIGSGFKVGSGPTIDSVVYEGMSTSYEDKIKPNGVYNFQQEYMFRTINTDLSLLYQNIFSTNFDGINDYVEFGSGSIFTFGDGSDDIPFSISLWLKFEQIGQNNIGIAGKDTSAHGKEWQIYVTTTELRFRLFDNSQGSYISTEISTLPNSGNWYHLCCTYDGSSSPDGMTIYLDGIKPTQTKVVYETYVAMENTSSGFTLGKVADASFDGFMDEVSLWNTELPVSRVEQIYNAGSPNDLASEANLIGWWRMGDSGVFPTIDDNSTNSNAGECLNMAASDFEKIIP